MNKDKIISSVLLEYSLLAENAGIGGPIDSDLLMTVIEKLGYQSYFSNGKLLESLTINEAPTPEYMSDEDVELFTDFAGPRTTLSPEELKKVDLSKIKNKIPNVFPAPEHTGIEVPVSTLDDMVEKHVAGGNKILVTKAPTKLRIYLPTQSGGPGLPVTVIILPKDGVKIGDRTFYRLLMLIDFYKKHRNDIEGASREAAGLGPQNMQVEQLNTYFKQNNPTKVPFHLFIKDGPHTVDCGVSVDGASVISGSGKADFSMSNKSAEVFWVSFKSANYLDAKDKTKLAPPGFENYAGSSELRNRYSNNPVLKGIIKKLLAGMIAKAGTNVLDVSSSNITFKSIENVKNPILNTIDKKPISKLVSDDNIKQLIQRAVAVEKLVNSDEYKGYQKKIYFVNNDQFSVAVDFLDGTRETRELAGKAIYGLDFEIDDSGRQKVKFGRENVNILMKSRTPITVEPFVKGKEAAILISTDARGHVLFNPNLPLPKDMDDPILAYKPVLNAQHFPNEIETIVIGKTVHLFLGTRIFVLPHARAKGAVFVK